MTPTLPILRPATSADASLIADMHGRSRLSAYRGLVPDDYLDHVMASELQAHWAIKMQQLEAGEGLALIAELAGTPVGFVCMSRPDEARGVYIDNLHAMPGHKGSGVGSAMLEAARHWALEHGANHLHLLVIEGNVDAIGFYEHRGWRHAGSAIDEMGGIGIAALRYELTI